MQSTIRKDMQTKSSRTVNKHMAELIAVIDATPFNRNPYRGIFARLYTRLGYRSRWSMHRAVKRDRNPRALLAVAREIKRIHDELDQAAREVVS